MTGNSEEFASAEKATSLAGVPYTYEMLKKLKFMEMELPNLKTMTQAEGGKAFRIPSP